MYLGLSFLATLALFYVPGGHYLSYPLMLISTVAHEMGHGLAALLVGGRFESFKMWSNGSGIATWSAHVGPVGRAWVAAGGLIGPAIAAGLAFWFGRTTRSAQRTLAVSGIVLLLATLLVVRTLFGFLFVGLLAVALFVVALYASANVAQATLLFLGVQLALSVFSRGDYLFTETAQTTQGPMPSDVGQMAQALWLPYWFWGGLCGLASITVILLGLLSMSPGPRRRARRA